MPCSYCRQDGHYRTTCPKLDKDTVVLPRDGAMMLMKLAKSHIAGAMAPATTRGLLPSAPFVVALGRSPLEVHRAEVAEVVHLFASMQKMIDSPRDHERIREEGHRRAEWLRAHGVEFVQEFGKIIPVVVDDSPLIVYKSKIDHAIDLFDRAKRLPVDSADYVSLCTEGLHLVDWLTERKITLEEVEGRLVARA